jgi:hypothetical protein
MNWSIEQLKEALKKNPALKVKQSELEKLESTTEKKHKFNAKPGYLDGIYFDSQAEMERYGELKLLKLAGVVKSFKVHPKYKVSNKKYYELDFEVEYPDGHIEVEDVKGVETDIWKLKADLFKERYPDLKLVIIKN